MPESYIDKVAALAGALPTMTFADTLIGITTFTVLIYWRKLKIAFPPHLPAILAGVLMMFLLDLMGLSAATIGSRFSYVLADGSSGQGIPPILPQFVLPWNMPESPLQLNWQTFSALLPIALTMAVLCAIESLLCAVVLDGMTETKHSSNSELFGQGLGNMIAPFFGGISATAAIARSAANVRAGATSPISAALHAMMVLIALVSLAPALSFLPLAAMSALLLIVAWNMSEAAKVMYILKRAPKDDIITLLLCMSLTVLFDMVVAITVGIVLASLLFMRRIARMTRLNELPAYSDETTYVIRVNGPLFFAAAEKIFVELYQKTNGYQNIILQWDAVPILDAGGLNALLHFIEHLADDKQLLICELQFQPLKTLARANIAPIPGKLTFYSTLQDALDAAKQN